jgi:hypothetical protein
MIWKRNEVNSSLSEPRIDGLTLQSQDTEHAFVGAAKWFLANETFKSFDAQGKLPAC